MKKLYFIAAAIMATSTVFGQDFTAKAGKKLSTIQNKPSEVLWAQEQTSTNGIVSDVLADGTL